MKATGLSADQCGRAFITLTNATDALECVRSQIEAMRVALLHLVPLAEHAAELPLESRQKLDAARVLLDRSLHFQVGQLGDWVGQELEELAKVLKGGAA